jgi:dTDP-4-amino-4,6-dideoxygalactose transaminase
MSRPIAFGRPITTDEERQAIDAVLSSGVLTQGPTVKRFEADFAAFTGAPHAVATSSCMGALHLAYLALGLAPGDEVIVPAQTHVATAMAVEACGGRCTFVDVDAATGNLDLAAVEAAITPRTRAITLVHFLGLPVDMRALMALARRRGLHVVEDCALALGATVAGVHVGLWGDAGAFSFYPAKHITTGEGGMLISRRGEVAARVASQRAFAVERAGEGIRPGGTDYDVVALGFNYRMNELSAALGVVQMTRLPGFLAARRSNASQLATRLAEIDGISILPSSVGDLQGACYCVSFVLDDALGHARDALIDHLRAHAIGVSVYYPRPVPAMRFFRERYRHADGAFPNASRISAHSIALPVGPHLGEEDMARMAEAVGEGVARLSNSRRAVTRGDR